MAYQPNVFGPQLDQLAKQSYLDPVEVKPTAIGTAEYAMEQARDLSLRIQALADRILGPVPPSPTSAGKSIDVDPMGVFPILISSSERTQSVLSEGFDAINRIERSLP